jgi:hypothetical protein
LGEEGLPSKCAGAGSKERTKWGTKEQQPGLIGYAIFFFVLFLRWAIIPGQEPRFISIKSLRYWFSLGGFSKGIYPKNHVCTLCLVSYLCFRCNVSLKTHLCFSSID